MNLMESCPQNILNACCKKTWWRKFCRLFCLTNQTTSHLQGNVRLTCMGCCTCKHCRPRRGISPRPPTHISDLQWGIETNSRQWWAFKQIHDLQWSELKQIHYFNDLHLKIYYQNISKYSFRLNCPRPLNSCSLALLTVGVCNIKPSSTEQKNHWWKSHFTYGKMSDAKI